MKKIHLLLKKEDIEGEKLNSGKKVAVVLDVLLATTTITAALEAGAKEVVPVLDSQEALEEAKKYQPEEIVLAGELNAKPLEGFVYPSPFAIREKVKGKTLILSTTNGTVALRRSEQADKVFIAAIVNNPYVADAVRQEPAETIVVVCSGNATGFSLEDFYGAGHFIDCLVQTREQEFELTDSALAALHFFRGNHESGTNILAISRVGRMFRSHDGERELAFAAEGAIPLVPVMKDGKAILGRHAMAVVEGGRTIE